MSFKLSLLSCMPALFLVSCGKADFRGLREIGSQSPTNSASANVSNPSGSAADQEKSSNVAVDGRDAGSSGTRAGDGGKPPAPSGNGLKPNIPDSDGNDKSFHERALGECLSSWKNHPFAAQEIEEAKKNPVNIAVQNANGTQVYKDDSNTEKPNLKLISISAAHNLNDSSISLLNSNGYYCVVVRAGNNANGLQALYRCNQNAKVHFALNVSLNSHGASLKCVP